MYIFAPAMKQVRYLFFIFAIVVVASCRTSTYVRHYHSGPDDIHSGLLSQSQGGTEAQAQMRREETHVVYERVIGIAAELDKLLNAEDTILQRSQLGLHVVDLTAAEVIYARNAHQRMRPASTEKVATAVTALDLLGPEYQLTTQLLSSAGISGSTLHGDLYLKGVMDPLLSTGDVRSLASQLRNKGIRAINGRLIADASFKDADEYGWGWCWDDENPVLSPFLCNGKPTLIDQLIAALRAEGITVSRGTSIGLTPTDVRPLAMVSHPLTAVLKPMLKESDNLCAEAVFYHIGKYYAMYSSLKSTTKSYSRKQASAAVNAVINKSHLPVWGGREGTSTVADGSGLSLYNYQTPAAFTCMLAYATTRPEAILNPLLAALPIASVDGTLKNRMSGTAAAANVRAKTGSVNGVSTLVGYTTQRSTGHFIAFAIMNQGVERMSEGRSLQDKICALLSE